MAFTPIQKTLERVLRGFNIKDLDSIKIFAIWERITGEKLAAHCQPHEQTGEYSTSLQMIPYGLRK